MAREVRVRRFVLKSTLTMVALSLSLLAGLLPSTAWAFAEDAREVDTSALQQPPTDASSAFAGATMRVVVGFEPGSEAQAITSSLLSGAKDPQRAKAGGFCVVHAPPGTDLTAFAHELSTQPGVQYAEPDGIVSASMASNDPGFPSQWGMSKIGAPMAWDTARGSSVKVAVVDSGVDLDHPDLVGRLDTDNDYDFVNSDSTAQDDQGHGTHVAGIIGATLNNGLGVAGVANQCTILPVKVLGAGNWGWSSDVADGIRWAADNGAEVINLSLGSASDDSVQDAAVQYAVSRDCVVVASAGNDASYGVLYPAADDNVVGVGSTTTSDTLSDFSNYGPEVDIAAPGSAVYSTTYDGGYGNKTGTSMAAPHVAGVVALIRSKNPTWTRSQVESQLFSTALDLGSAGRDDYFGHGRVRAATAVGPTIPGGNLSGTVSSNGSWLSGVSVTVPGYTPVITGEGGLYLISGIAAGTYDVRYFKSGFTSQTQSVTFSSGGTANRNVSMRVSVSDTTPPILSSLSLTPSVVDVGASAQTITFTARIQDDLSGFSYGYVKLRSPSGDQSAYGYWSTVSGTVTDGIYTATATIPRNAEAGIWTVQADVYDDLSNSSSLYPVDLVALGFPSTVVVSSAVSDTTPPVLSSLSLNPNSVDVGASAQTITFTARIQDDLSGFSYGYLVLRSPSKRQSVSGSWVRVSGTTMDGVYTAMATIPKNAEAGTWTVRADMYDGLSNPKSLSPGELVALGFPSTVVVSSAVSDTTPPDLSSLSLNPSAVDVGASAKTVTATARIKDDLSGFGYGDLELYSPSKRQSVSGSWARVSGTTMDGVYTATATIPKNAESGTWLIRVTSSDAVGNAKQLYSANLAALGFSSTVAVTADPTTTYTISASSSGNGSVTPEGITTVAWGGSRTFTIAAHAGYHVEDVLVDGSSVGVVANYTFTNVTANHTISATFAANTTTPTYKTVYRFRNLRNGFYLWTADENEKNTIVRTLQGTWLLEGPAYKINTANTLNSSPLWRFVNIRGGYYLYTANPAEKASIIAKLGSTWRYEGPAYNVSTNTSGSPVWRFRNKGNGTYLYSADLNEKNSIVAKLGATWQLEGPAYYLAP